MAGLLTAAQEWQLIQNGAPDNAGKDHYPVVKLLGDLTDSFLLAEIDPDSPEYAFGLLDYSYGKPEYGYVSIDWLLFLQNATGLLIEPDTQFKGQHPISVYAKAAALAGKITDDPILLAKAQAYGGTKVTKPPKPSPP